MRVFASIVGARELTAQLGAIPSALLSRMTATLRRLAIRLQARVKMSKLSGQVLKTRTGTLRRSINYEIKRVSTSRIEAIVGTNVEYARAHEYGFKGRVRVKEHLRIVKEGRRKFSTWIRAHDKVLNLPERSFLRSALREMQPEIVRELRRTATETTVVAIKQRGIKV